MQTLITSIHQDTLSSQPDATPPFAPSTLEQVAEILRYSGQPKTQADIDVALQQGIMEHWHDRS